MAKKSVSEMQVEIIRSNGETYARTTISKMSLSKLKISAFTQQKLSVENRKRNSSMNANKSDCISWAEKDVFESKH